MAVTESEPNLTAQVYVNGAPLEEFENDKDEDNDVDTPTSTTKYVEATAGAAFEIVWVSTPQFRARHDIQLRLSLDGHPCEYRLVSKKRLSNGGRERLDGIGMMTQAQCFVRKYMFADIDIDETQSGRVDNKLIERIKKVGSITLECAWVRVLGHKDVSQPTRDLKKLDQIPEKALKGRAVSTCVKLGQPQYSEGSTSSFDYEYIAGSSPFAMFTFKYRSRKNLQALLIIPRSPSPVPLEERDIKSLSRQEMRELLRRHKERERAEKHVKLEHGHRRTRSMISGDNETSENKLDVLFISSGPSKRFKHDVTVDSQGRETIGLT